MDEQSQQLMTRLIREVRIAALGTLHEGNPNLAMVAVTHSDDFLSFYIHVSKLGKHTRDMESTANVSLLLMEIDDGRTDPQTLTRLSLNGTAAPLPKMNPNYNLIKQNYLVRFPEAEPLFGFGDFSLWQINIQHGRFVAGFGKAFNLVPEALKKASQIQS